MVNNKFEITLVPYLIGMVAGVFISADFYMWATLVVSGSFIGTYHHFYTQKLIRFKRK